MIMIDKLSYSSKLRYKSPSLKVLLSVSSLLICVISRSILIAVITLFIMGGLTVVKGGTSFSRYRHFMMLPVVFILLSTVAIIVNYSEVPLSSLAIPFLGKYITVSRSSLFFALQLILTALASVSCLYFLSLTTPITDILTVLKKCRCPLLILELMLLIYRFIFILLDLAGALTTAQHSRLGNRNFKTSCISSGNLMAVLLVRSLQKSSRLYDAMESRCYDGTISVLSETYPASKKELTLTLLLIASLTAAAVLMRVLGFNI